MKQLQLKTFNTPKRLTRHSQQLPNYALRSVYFAIILLIIIPVNELDNFKIPVFIPVVATNQHSHFLCNIYLLEVGHSLDYNAFDFYTKTHMTVVSRDTNHHLRHSY